MPEPIFIGLSIAICWLRLLSCIFIDPCDNSLGDIFRFQDLDEWVFMAQSILTEFTVIEIFADTTLVSDASYRTDPTAITGNIRMSY
jgi:hypothetical protein